MTLCARITDKSFSRAMGTPPKSGPKLFRMPYHIDMLLQCLLTHPYIEWRHYWGHFVYQYIYSLDGSWIDDVHACRLFQYAPISTSNLKTRSSSFYFSPVIFVNPASISDIKIPSSSFHYLSGFLINPASIWGLEIPSSSFYLSCVIFVNPASISPVREP